MINKAERGLLQRLMVERCVGVLVDHVVGAIYLIEC